MALIHPIPPCCLHFPQGASHIPVIIGGYSIKYNEARRIAHRIDPVSYGVHDPFLATSDSTHEAFMSFVGQERSRGSFTSFIHTIDVYCRNRFQCPVLYFPSEDSGASMEDGYALFAIRSRYIQSGENPEDFSRYEPSENDVKWKALLERRGVQGLEWTCVCTRYF